MEHLTIILLGLGGFVGAVLVALAKDEVGAWVPHLAQWIVRCAASWPPKEERERWGEEWAADLRASPGGKLSHLGRALAIAWMARRQYRRRWIDGEIAYQRNVMAMCVVVAALSLEGIRRGEYLLDAYWLQVFMLLGFLTCAVQSYLCWRRFIAMRLQMDEA